MSDATKPVTSKSLSMISAGKSGTGSGPTGSSRSYPKKGATVANPSTSSPDFNPMKCGKGSTYGINGV